MELSERQLKILIREMVEGIFDGGLGSGRPTPPPPDVKAQVRSKELENSKRLTTAAAKKLSPVVSAARGEIEKMEPEALKKFVYDFGEESKAVDQKDTQKLAAGVLHMSTKDGRTAPEITDALKKNPKLRAAVVSTPGMMDLQAAVDINMRVAGKDPNRSVGDAWRELGKIASSKGLSERRVRGTSISESRLQQLVREELLREVTLKDVWNSKATDWSLTALGAAADLFPGPGNAVSASIAATQALRASAASDWLGVVLSLLAIFPVVGDSLGALGRALRDGVNVGKPMLRVAAKAIGDIGTDQIITYARKIPQLAPYDEQISAAFNDFKGDLMRRAAAT